MTELVAAIDNWMETRYGHLTHTFFGFCELSNRTHENSVQPIPAKVSLTHKRTQVALDDKKQLITWIRATENITTGKEVDGNDWDFGLRSNTVQNLTLTLFVAHKIELGEDLIYDIADGLPDFLAVNGYSLVSVERSGVFVDPDHEKIYNQEFGTGRYEQHRFPWNVYALAIPLQVIKNDNCVSYA